MPQRTVAIFVDAGFFTRIFTKSADPSMSAEPEKLARVEGAHFILDAMGRKVKGDLAEHIDGLKSFINQVELT